MLDEANINWLWASLAMGIGATLAIDLWAMLLKRSFAITPTNWAMVGRWIGGIRQGRLRLQGETGETPLRYELQLGWVVHYGVGIAYAFAYIAIIWATSASLSLSTALLFGLATLVAPWLILQPALGKGWFGAATPNPALTRLLNIVVHLIFGAALYLMWRIYLAAGM